ncbi:hypothetical protein D3C85_1803740 [compost metagenome]
MPAILRSEHFDLVLHLSNCPAILTVMKIGVPFDAIRNWELHPFHPAIHSPCIAAKGFLLRYEVEERLIRYRPNCGPMGTAIMGA